MAQSLENLRNIGIVAHIDAGKTTVTERMLYYAGATHRMGEVDKGTTVTDDDAEEQERGITIYSASVRFKWKEFAVNLIDTPGHVDFTAEVERSLRVLDGGVVVFSAREGVEAQSETVWRQADRYHVPRIAFINKMDREGADFHSTLDEIRDRLEANPVAIQIPVGVGPPHIAGAFRGIIDLVTMKFLTFTPESMGKEVVESEIPDDLLDEARLWRDQMLEKLYDYSNELMELALAESPVPDELVRRVLRDATTHRLIVPVLCGSALDHIGIQPLLDAVGHYLPSPLDRPPVKGSDPQKPDKELQRKPSNGEPFCGLVFKVVADKHGDLSFVRIYSGVLKANTRAYNPGKDKKENVAQLWHVQASRKEQVPQVETGDIVGIIGLRNSVTGDTLCDAKQPILLESIQFPETVMAMAIEPETSAERKKLADTLEMLKRQDPTFRAATSEETGQTIISGMGELHLEVIKHRLLRDFNLNVKVKKPQVSYRETIKQAVEVTGECNQHVAGQLLFARVTIRMEPQLTGERAVSVLPGKSEGIPPELLSSVLEALTQEAEGGGSLGYPLMKVRITVLGGETSEVGSNEIAFRRAAADAFRTGLREAGIVLLEPIMKLEITTPEEHLGDIVSDLQQRRAVITETLVRGRNTVIEAEAPLANLFGYSSAIRSLSQGRASCSMEPTAYGPAPDDVLKAFT
ncbi:MAG: elongation factor G [Planctomycetia bacterium 21-64-5]|nr:MAG: elongation factor G [Planctomycetia bacterium 21-64-5]HQU43342.1 elongation factor G [Pirellulales bacterium]